MVDNDRIVKSQAFVITQTDYGEADRLYTIFSRSKGKIKAFARGVRKARSRKAGHLQPISLIHLVLAKGKTFWIVTQSETVNPMVMTKNDLQKTAKALYCMELVDRFLPEEEPLPLLFDTLRDTLERIDQQDDLFFVIKFFEFQLLKLTGYMPDLVHCVACRQIIQPEDQYFSAEQGGVLCPECAKQHFGSRKISMTALKYLRFIQRSPYTELQRARINNAVRAEMNQVMQYYLTYINERILNTAQFLQQLGENNRRK